MIRRDLLRAALASPGVRALQAVSAVSAAAATDLAMGARRPSALHYYTTSRAERDQAVQAGYGDEGILAYLVPASAETVRTDTAERLKMPAPEPGLIPLFRSFSPGKSSHFYTTDLQEWLHAVQALGHQPEGIIGWMAGDESFKPRPRKFFKVNPLAESVRYLKLIPIYRMYNAATDDHFLARPDERADFRKRGYTDDPGAAGRLGFAYYPANEWWKEIVPLYRL